MPPYIAKTQRARRLRLDVLLTKILDKNMVKAPPHPVGVVVGEDTIAAPRVRVGSERLPRPRRSAAPVSVLGQFSSMERAPGRH